MRSPTHSQERAAAGRAGNQGGWLCSPGATRPSLVGRQRVRRLIRLGAFTGSRTTSAQYHTEVVAQLLLPDRVKRAAWPS